MTSQTIDFRAVELALERVSSGDFEKFAQAFYGAIQGTNYVPLGGTHDGGAEGFDVQAVFGDDRPERFMQASITADSRAKIRGTIKRIREFGRNITSLIYVTSVVVPRIDAEEELLSEETGVLVRIRDAKYISAHVNDSLQTIQAFKSFVAHHLYYLREIGGAENIGENPKLPSRSLCVFLGQELERRRGNTELLEAVTDSLILWSLEGTDPDKGIFMNRDEILKKVEAALPSAADFIRGVIDDRLERLSAKENTSGREIRRYRKEKRYCLPFETRQIVEKENEEDEFLRTSVSEVFRSRIAAMLRPDDAPEVVLHAVRACHRALELTFETQGLEMAYFVSGDEPEGFVPPAISDNLHDAMASLGISGDLGVRAAELAYYVLRATIYDSSEEERIYLGKMSRTYILMFLLRNDPKIVEYFRTMSSDLILYIGTDIIIRSISEYYLLEKDQSTIRTLEILRAAGANLVITERCVEEVWTHLKATSAEYENHYAELEPYVSFDLARNIDRILIRAYYYARLSPDRNVKRPAGWRSYIGNYCDYKSLHREKGREEIREYLIKRFGFEYESDKQMMDGVDSDALIDLSKKILNERRQKNAREKEERLAENDAMHVLRVYARRLAGGERNYSNPFGFKTWWLTQDASVRRATGMHVAMKGSRFMMRPEFLLHFIALSPSADKVRKSFETVFPTLLGVRLSSRLKEDAFKSAIDEVGKVFEVDEARAAVRLAELSNQLKSDFLKQYQ
ncbi:hypothetical protein [Hoeflea sp. 108]|uniref:hypothetical protein n=1 Tax=Hoeflea sp. 108 TaxID=1116369 RepID=UPI000375DEB5|nr:hypothetical protein [Hoeflea sp. 108]